MFIIKQYNNPSYHLSNPILGSAITFELREMVLHIRPGCGIRIIFNHKFINIIAGIEGKKHIITCCVDKQMNKSVFTIMIGILLLVGFGCSHSGCDVNSTEHTNAQTPSPIDTTAVENVAYIAQQVADGIEGMKSKYPHLGGFSTAEHLAKNTVHAGFLPGTPSNPELLSISYYNGILRKKPTPQDGKRRSVEDIFDPSIGIRLYVHFFKGRKRGNDMRIPQKIGDLSIHLYVNGPAADSIRGDIQRILDVIKMDYE